MTREEFDDLVRTVEDGVGRDPSALRRRVLGWAAIGYVGLLAPVLFAVLVAGVFFSAIFWADATGKVVSIVVGTIVLLGLGSWGLRSLLPSFSPPDGLPITRADAPELFAVLDALRAQLQASAFHHVLLTPECNAGVIQVPRLGVLGWSRNYLRIGLPLLDGLSPDEMRAVLAHEFAHLSRAHGRFSHWIYRLRRSWERLFHELSRPRRAGEYSLRHALAAYVAWFWPRFNAHAFVLSRAQEFEADATAVQLVGRDPSAAALIRLQYLSRRLGDEFWPRLWQTANESAEPPVDALERARDALHAPASTDDLRRWREEALRVVTTNADTHPCLKVRLAALVGDAALPTVETCAARPSAAEVLLGANERRLRQAVSESWEKTSADSWRERHARASALARRLTALEVLPAAAALTPAEVDRLWDKATVSLDLHGGEAAEPLLRQIVAARPDHVAANFHLGRLLLEKGQPEGETLLETAVAANDELTPQAGAVLHGFYRESGQTAKLRALSARLDRYEQSASAARTERSTVNADDCFIAHGLDDSQLTPLRAVLDAEPEADHADLVQKQLLHFPERRLFVLCVYRPVAWHRFPDADADRDLARRLAQKVVLPGRVLVCSPSGTYRSLSRAIRRVPDAAIWQRDGSRK